MNEESDDLSCTVRVDERRRWRLGEKELGTDPKRELEDEIHVSARQKLSMQDKLHHHFASGAYSVPTNRNDRLLNPKVETSTERQARFAFSA